MIVIVLLVKTPVVSHETGLQQVVPLLKSVLTVSLNPECLIDVHKYFTVF